MNIPRRTCPRVLLAAVLALVTLSACSASTPEDADGSGPDEDGRFPVMVEHGQGTVEIPERPERVVALSWTDLQIAQALDAPVVAAVRNPDTADGNWPGTSLEDEMLSLDSVTPELEKIAAHDPDLILMTASQPTFSEEYERLSQIAPTVSYHSGLLQDDGDTLTEMIGSALGKEEEAEELIASSAAAMAAFTEEHPGLDGATVVMAQYYQGSTGAIVTEGSPVVGFFARLGLEVPDELAGLADDDTVLGTVELSDENLSLLDSADAAFVNAPEGEGAFAAIPTVAALELTEDGRLFFTGNELASLLLTPNPATTDLLLDHLREPLGALSDHLAGT